MKIMLISESKQWLFTIEENIKIKDVLFRKGC